MKSAFRTFLVRLRREYVTNRTTFVLRTTILALIVVIYVSQRTFWTPDMLFLTLLVVSIAFGQTRNFLIRFLPLVSLLLVYEAFRGVADDLNGMVHFTEMIDADRWLFLGQLPTVVLQSWWWHGTVQWYDFYFYFLYTIHFVVPLSFAVVLWKRAEQYYWPFVWALVGLSFAAFVTYIAFPAAPPWMAKDLGIIIEPLHRVSSDIWAAMGIQNFSEVYSNLPANPVAAVPSLHSAYPLLIALFVTRIFGLRKYWWVYVYPLSMWIGVVYMGEHYVIDVVLGALYALAAFVASIKIFAWYRQPGLRLRRIINRILIKLHLK